MRRLFGPNGRRLAGLLLLPVLVVMLFPFYVIGRGAMTFQDETGLSHIGFRNWRVLLAHLPVGQQLLNSTIVTVGSVALILLVSVLAAFALTKLRMPLGGPLLGAVAA